jgi:hypothetical protein
MKTIITALALMTMVSVCTVAQAESTQSIDEFCTNVATLAGKIMEGRQDGVLMEDMFKVFGPEDRMFRGMVVAAYEQSMYSTPVIKNRAILDFRNDWFRSCIKVKSKE